MSRAASIPELCQLPVCQWQRTDAQACPAAGSSVYMVFTDSDCAPAVCLAASCQLRGDQHCHAIVHGAPCPPCASRLNLCVWWPHMRVPRRVVKGVFAFPDWDMLVAATSSQGLGLRSCLGKLRVMHLPSPADLEGAEARRLHSMATPHRVPQPTVELQVYVHDAHTQQILAAARQVGSCWWLEACMHVCGVPRASGLHPPESKPGCICRLSWKCFKREMHGM